MGFLLKFAYGLNGIMNGITTIERMEHWAENHQNNTSAKMTLYPDPILLKIKSDIVSNSNPDWPKNEEVYAVL